MICEILKTHQVVESAKLKNNYVEEKRVVIGREMKRFSHRQIIRNKNENTKCIEVSRMLNILTLSK